METKTNMNENFEHNTFDDFDDLHYGAARHGFRRPCAGGADDGAFH